MYKWYDWKNVVLGTDKYMGIYSIYNFGYDSGLEIEKVAYRRVPSVYLTCLEVLKKTRDIQSDDKEQSRYGVNERRVPSL